MGPNCNQCGETWCKSCSTCHYCGNTVTGNCPSGSNTESITLSSFLGEPAVSSPPSLTQLPTVVTNSQKVKGIRALQSSGMFGGRTLPIQAHITKETLLEGMAAASEAWSWPLFARPCPITPKHGFVESRGVKNWEEVLAVWSETLAADPEGELILMPLIRATANAIWTPTLVTIGAGHDGATAGKNTLTMPLLGTVPTEIHELLPHAGIKPGQAPYIEAVWAPGGSGVKLTQLRAGPPIEAMGPDWIPEGGVVTAVIRPAGEDLLKWAARIESAPPGTVVYHPGGSPADHYFVHARLSKIPVITSFEPKVGDDLVATKVAPLPDPAAVLRGVVDADLLPMKVSDLGPLVGIMLLALHNSAAMSGPHGRWIGFAAGIMLRAGSLALRGEARHRIGSGKLTTSSGFGKGPRDAVYGRMAGRSLSFHRAGLNRLATTFQYGQWSGKGYGGPKWAQCALSLQGLFNAIQQLANTQDDDSVAALTKALNIAVNQAHNGGWWLNKFVSQDLFDSIQEGDVFKTLEAARHAFTVAQVVSMSPPDRIAARISKYAAWPDTEIRAPRLGAVEMTSLPGTDGLVLHIRSRLVGKQFRSVPITLNKLNNLLEVAMSNARLQESPGGGLRLVADISYPAATLWEVPPITLEEKK